MGTNKKHDGLPFELSLSKIGTPPGISLDIQITKNVPQGHMRRPHPDSRGLFEWTAGRIWIERVEDPVEVRKTLLHEVLHAVLASEEIIDELDLSPEKEELLCERLDSALDSYLQNQAIQQMYSPVVPPKLREKR